MASGAQQGRQDCTATPTLVEGQPQDPTPSTGADSTTKSYNLEKLFSFFSLIYHTVYYLNIPPPPLVISGAVDFSSLFSFFKKVHLKFCFSFFLINHTVYSLYIFPPSYQLIVVLRVFLLVFPVKKKRKKKIHFQIFFPLSHLLFLFLDEFYEFCF